MFITDSGEGIRSTISLLLRTAIGMKGNSNRRRGNFKVGARGHRGGCEMPDADIVSP
jgi:hypothetical protein